LALASFLLAGWWSFAEAPKDAPAKAKEPITYAKQVSRIIQENCQTCHHPGTAAPFSLLTYEQAVNWSETIKEVLVDKRMPPWHADPRYGKFSNDRRLKKEESDTILAWIDSGMKLGDKKDLPAPKTFADGWVIGKPDLVFEMPSEQTVPADGVVPYQYFVTPTNFEEDVWIQAAEARPGNRAVVHHIIVSFREPKSKGRQGGLGDGFLVGTAPGDMPLILRPGMAKRIPAGADLIWQMHYTPNGKETKDRSQVGFIVYRDKEPPRWTAQTRGISNGNFVIPPGDANHLVESGWVVLRDTLLLSFMPHMHLRGKDFEYRAEYPDGHKEVLLSVPRYDFSWQASYRLAEPVRLPKGTRIHCTAHFDNSASNPANPDPKKEVTWGDQTWEEMMIGWVDYVWEQPEKEAVLEGFKAF
jgi:mono/diheme cytochrome c family protein